jgi:lipopolysaccharide transport system permease protein
MAFLMAGHGILPSLNLLLLPLFAAGTVLAALGFGILSAALVVAYRDFRYVVPFVVQLWMFASPVAYPLDTIPAAWQLAYSTNPAVGMISGSHSCLLGQPFRWDCIGISFMTALAFLAAGLVYFRQVERRFADII